MPLSGLNRASARPRGGVAKVEIIPASEYAGVAPPATGPSWAFREDRARYSEEQPGQGGRGALTPLVRHTLEMELPANNSTRAAVESLLSTAQSEGVVARVTMASGEVLLVGWSRRLGARYPLRVAAVAANSGQSPADFPTITVRLESTDADAARSPGE